MYASQPLLHVQSTLDISKYPLKLKNIVWTHLLLLLAFQLLLSQTTDIEK